MVAAGETGGEIGGKIGPLADGHYPPQELPNSLISHQVNGCVVVKEMGWLQDGDAWRVVGSWIP